jgi:hypothetical protein
MSLWEAIPFILLGVLVVLIPIGIIGLFASRLLPQQRLAFLAIYGAVVVLLAIIAADLRALLPSRLLVDLVLLAGGVLVGGFAGAFLPFRWPRRPAERRRIS